MDDDNDGGGSGITRNNNNHGWPQEVFSSFDHTLGSKVNDFCSY